ncbi:phosphodiester glycosidase family protein [Pseudarthrobacter sp. L1SW]|uniref:phosphodiester glycosidase family protein n=1 Tax=Pseudarthrobacter sp. L1SW TaxID=2851598 RepID=UPI001E2F6D25|nr:phosphodiester glycosidase family protein [Pseudarthrobacter sp. L1SW]UEL29224.1 phosphodiester glycosidase family protein [Pseudarthrobacter sp. L1SW]
MESPHKLPVKAAVAALVLGLPGAFLTTAGPSAASPSLPSGDAKALPAVELNLGAQDLPETRDVTELAPGLTRTSITRGTPNPSLFWTAEVAIPADSPDPDAPSSALSGEAQAQSVANAVTAAGVAARVEKVQSPQLAGAGGDLGYRVRAGQFATKDDGAATVARIKAAGYSSSVLYTGWDGDAGSTDQSRGQWKLEVLTIDPKQFKGELSSTFGSDLVNRETTSQLAATDGALAGMNGGYFVLDPKAGAPGDPAGTAVVNGEVLSEPVGDRPSLVIDGKKNESSIQRLGWRGSVTAAGGAPEDSVPPGGAPEDTGAGSAAKDAPLALDGINRVPGLIRNCGGTGDAPTVLPLHDYTCTDPDEVIAFTEDFGSATPSGPGLEVLLDSHGTVTAVSTTRGTAVPAGGRTLQATGADVATLGSLATVGARLDVDADLVSGDGKPLKTNASTDVVNGGPVLVSGGTENVTVKRDGMVRSGDNNSFYYGWVHKRNPRTIAGVDGQGRTLLVTADGRQTASLGLSIKEAADVARSLGMVDAINLDGGGSTTMAVGGQVVNRPSDASGERPVGDAILALPRRKD